MTGRLAGFRPSPRNLAIWAAATGFCVMAGPFGTDDMPAATRAVYWAISVAGAMALSLTAIPYAFAAPALDRLPSTLRGLIGAAVFSIVYAALASSIGALVFEPGASPGFWRMIAYVAPIAAAITVLVALFAEEATGDAATPAAASSPRFLKRLKPTLGRRLIRLSMQDHYVEAVTDRGAQLVLMRLSDAVEELEGAAGWRIHRSHWVAEEEIEAVLREGGKTRLRMTDGSVLPVSRTYLPALREAGVLKRFS